MNDTNQKVLDIVKKHQESMLDPTQPILMTLMNPFRRHGVTIESIACDMGWFTDEVYKSGGRKVDWKHARLMIKCMVQLGLLVEYGRARTLQAGSRKKAMYVTPDYEARVKARMEQYNVSND